MLACRVVKGSKPESPDEPSGSRWYTIECYEPEHPLGTVRRFRVACNVREELGDGFLFGGSGRRLADTKVFIGGGINYVVDPREGA